MQIKYYIILISVLFSFSVQAESLERKALWEEYVKIRTHINTVSVQEGLKMADDFLDKDLSDFPDIRSHIIIGKAFCYLQLNNPDTSRLYLDKAKLIIDKYDLDSLYAPLLMIRGMTSWKEFDFKNSIALHKQALQTATKYQKVRTIMQLNYYLGIAHKNILSLDSASYFIHKALEIAQREGYHTNAANALTVLSTIEKARGSLNRAMDYTFQSQNYARTHLKDFNQIRFRHYALKIAEIYYDLGNATKSLNYIEQVIEQKREIQNLLYLESNMLSKASLLLRLNRLEDCIAVVKDLEANYPAINTPSYTYQVQAVRGGILYEQEQWKSAEEQLVQLLPVIDSVDLMIEDKVLSDGFLRLAKLYLRSDRHEKAIDICKRQLAGALIGYDHKKEFLGVLSTCYRALGENEKSYQCLLSRDAVHSIDVFYEGTLRLAREQELVDAQQAEAITQLERENERSQAKAEQQRTQMLFGGTLAFLLLSLIYLWGRQRKLQLENALVEVKQQLLKLQVNPHFIFNVLNSIQNSVLTLNKEKSVELISKFSKLTRQVLQNSDKVMVSIHEELQLLTNYMDLEKVRTKNKFDYEIEIDQGIDVYNEEVPSMMLQLFVENAIWHGILPKEEKGLIKVKFEKAQDRIRVIVEDDGIGRKMSAHIKSKDQKDKVSMGMHLVKQRISALNKKYKTNIELSVKDGVNGQGTQALLIA